MSNKGKPVNVDSLALEYKRAQSQITEGTTNVTKEDLVVMLNNMRGSNVPLYVVDNKVSILDRLSGLPTNIQVQRFTKEKLTSIMVDVDKIKDGQSLSNLFKGLVAIADKENKTSLLLGVIASTEGGIDMYRDLSDIQIVSNYDTAPQVLNEVG